jgi:uncharacterized membrane protein YbhN (UPF0104 family)
LRKLVLFAKLAITLGLLAYLWHKIDPQELWSQLRQSDPWILIAGTLVLAVLPMLGALRWRIVLSCLGTPSGAAQVTRWTYVSVFFSQVLPATIGGDALRIWLAHRAGFPISVAVNSVGLDRVAMFVTLMLLLAAATPGLGDLIGMERLDHVVAILLAATAAGLAALMLGDRLPERLRHLRAIRAIGYLAHDARRLFLGVRFGGAVLALSLASYLIIIVSVYLFALAFGAARELSQFFVLFPPVLVASSLPISIGGWGTREMAMVVALGTVGIGPHVAVLVSLWLGVASIVISLPGAFLYLVDRAPLNSQLDQPLRRES